MNIFVMLLTFLLTALLIVLAGIQVTPSELSRFELTRRATKDQRAIAALSRETQLANLTTIVWLMVSSMLVTVTILALATFGWGWGILYTVLVVIFFGAIARTSLVQALSKWLWAKLEPILLRYVDKLQPFLKTVRTKDIHHTDLYRRFDSPEELKHMIEQSGDVLSARERLLLASGLRFADRKVQEVMTPRMAIDSIPKDEFLGPLVLSELHELGHSRLPVVDGDLDHIIGILHLRDLLTLHDKKSATAQTVMEARVYYIHQEDTLEHALAAFLRTRHHLFVVINDSRETVGLLALEDVIEALIGRKIMDEDDNHADLQAVAKQRGQYNNRPIDHIDL